MACLLAVSCAPSSGVSERDVRQERVLSTQIEVSRLTGLASTRPLKAEFVSPASLRRYLEASIDREYPGDSLDRLRRAYAKLGFFPESFDLRDRLLELYTGQALGLYDPISKKLLVVRKKGSAGKQAWGPFGSIQAFLFGRDETQALLAHEVMHALQDEHFDLERLLFSRDENDDRRFALQAVVEGAAVLTGALVTIDPAMRSEAIAAWEGEPRVKSLLAGGGEPGSQSLRAAILYPYVYGTRFVSGVLRKGGWEAVRRLHRESPPLSSEQILHPEKYEPQFDEPERIDHSTFALRLPAAWSLVESNVIGEAFTALLLELYDVRSARQASEGWGGDRFSVFEHTEAGGPVLLWESLWDSEEDAKEFASALEECLLSRYGDLVRSSGERGYERGGTRVIIERGGRRVLLIDGVPGSLLGELEKALEGMPWS